MSNGIYICLFRKSVIILYNTVISFCYRRSNTPQIRNKIQMRAKTETPVILNVWKTYYYFTSFLEKKKYKHKFYVKHKWNEMWMKQDNNPKQSAKVIK